MEEIRKKYQEAYITRCRKQERRYSRIVTRIKKRTDKIIKKDCIKKNHSLIKHKNISVMLRLQREYEKEGFRTDLIKDIPFPRYTLYIFFDSGS